MNNSSSVPCSFEGQLSGGKKKELDILQEVCNVSDFGGWVMSKKGEVGYMPESLSDRIFGKNSRIRD